MVLLIIFSVLSELLAISTGFAKAVADLSEEGKIKFKPSRYWIKSMSSPNKWKDGDSRKGEKFFGSSRWFVSLTDAWHVFGFVFRVSYGTACSRCNSCRNIRITILWLLQIVDIDD